MFFAPGLPPAPGVLVLVETQKRTRQVFKLLLNEFKKSKPSRAWWRTLVIPVLWEAETGGSGFAASLSSRSLSPCLSLSLSLSHTHTAVMCLMSHSAIPSIAHRILGTISFFFFLRYRGLNPGASYLCATPLALFFILYFETWSHKVVEGLTK